LPQKHRGGVDSQPLVPSGSRVRTGQEVAAPPNFPNGSNVRYTLSRVSLQASRLKHGGGLVFVMPPSESSYAASSARSRASSVPPSLVVQGKSKAVWGTKGVRRDKMQK